MKARMLAVWIPQRKVLFAGDIVYAERLLAVFPISSTKDWLATFAKVEALDPQHIVPGQLVNFEALARRNASQVFVEVEKEEF